MIIYVVHRYRKSRKLKKNIGEKWQIHKISFAIKWKFMNTIECAYSSTPFDH